MVNDDEPLSELPAECRVFHLAKRQPVAESLGVDLGEYAFFLR